MKYAFNKVHRDKLDQCLAERDDAGLLALATLHLSSAELGRCMYAAWDRHARERLLLIPADVTVGVDWYGGAVLRGCVVETDWFQLKLFDAPKPFVVEVSSDDVSFTSVRVSLRGALRVSREVPMSFGNVPLMSVFHVSEEGFASLRGTLGAALHKKLTAQDSA